MDFITVTTGIIRIFHTEYQPGTTDNNDLQQIRENRNILQLNFKLKNRSDEF